MRVRLAPGRGERVAYHPPVARVAQRAVADPDPLALEEVRALDEPDVDLDGHPELGRERLGGLLGALQRARHHMRHVVAGERSRGGLGHLHTEFGQREPGQPAVQDLVRVVHLAVAQQVHDGPGAHVDTAAAARAAYGSAAATTSRAASSSAPDTNHASYALGGRYTPRASISWK